MTVWYFRTVATVWYFRTVLTVWYFRTVAAVWYFRSVPTVWYFRTVAAVWYFFCPFYNLINCMTPSGMISGKCVHKYFNLCMAHINNAISGHASGYLRSLSVETNIYCIKVSFYFLVLLYTF